MSDPTVPKSPQKFLLPLVLSVDSDGGRVDEAEVSRHLKESGLPRFLAEDLHDTLGRNPDAPMPFAVKDAGIDWEAVTEISTPELDKEIEATAGLSHLLRTALAWALSYAKANVDDLNESYQEDGLVTAQMYEALQKRFGLDV